MAYNDLYRLSVHALIFDSASRVLFLKTTYGKKDWTLPGGAIDLGETIHETLMRECEEELGRDIRILHLSGVYYHKSHNSHAFVFRCEFADGNDIQLSSEHSEFGYLAPSQVREPHQIKIQDCLDFNGSVVSRKFD